MKYVINLLPKAGVLFALTLILIQVFFVRGVIANFSHSFSHDNQNADQYDCLDTEEIDLSVDQGPVEEQPTVTDSQSESSDSANLESQDQNHNNEHLQNHGRNSKKHKKIVHGNLHSPKPAPTPCPTPIPSSLEEDSEATDSADQSGDAQEDPESGDPEDDNNDPEGMVSAASEMADTGVFEENLMNSTLLFGVLTLSYGLKQNGKKA